MNLDLSLYICSGIDVFNLMKNCLLRIRQFNFIAVLETTRNIMCNLRKCICKERFGEGK